MKKILTFLMILTLLAVSLTCGAAASGEENEVIEREYTVPTGLRFKYEPVIQENGTDCEMKYMWSKGSLGPDNCILEGDHTYTVRVRYEGEWWQKTEVITLHVSKDAVIPECTIDESLIDFGTHGNTSDASRTSPKGLDSTLITVFICVLAAALIVISGLIVKELLPKRNIKQ